MSTSNAIAGPSNGAPTEDTTMNGPFSPSTVTDRLARSSINPKPPTPSSQATERIFGGRKTGLVYSAMMRSHWRPDLVEVWDSDYEQAEDEEPERPARIASIWNALNTEKVTGSDVTLVEAAEHVKIRMVTKEEVMLIHSESHWDSMVATSLLSQKELVDRVEFYNRLSLYINQHTFECARYSCGGVIEMCRSVAEGRVKNGFAIVRPPGHHCEPEEPSGFCFFNNAAVAAKWLRTVYPETVKKVLILDWDVHHGNGTQRAFYYDPSVLYISLHRYLSDDRKQLFYPGTDWGSAERCGDGEGLGFNVNIGWPEGHMGDSDYLYAFQRLVMPIAREFNPDFVIVSAGFDAAAEDPLGHCNVTPQGFGHMTYLLASLAQGKIVLALEGGYHLNAISQSAVECIRVLMGEAPQSLPVMVASRSATETVDECILIQNRYWKSLPEVVRRDEAEAEGRVLGLAEILRMHRTYDLYHTHGLCTIPIAHPDLQAYDKQVMASENIYLAKTMVIFMHDLGNVRSEIPTGSADVHAERSYLIDSSAQILDWIKQREGWAILDVQVNPPPVLTGAPVKVLPEERLKRTKEIKKLIGWVWNQFVKFAQCENLVIITLGDACAPMSGFITQEVEHLKPVLKACIQLPGLAMLPVMKNQKQAEWFKSISLIIVPNRHPVKMTGAQVATEAIKHGNIVESTESRPTLILKNDWTTITDFLSAAVPDDPSAGAGEKPDDPMGEAQVGEGEGAVVDSAAAVAVAVAVAVGGS